MISSGKAATAFASYRVRVTVAVRETLMRPLVLTFLIVLSSALVACSRGDDAAAASTATETAEPAPLPQPMEAPTEAPVQQAAGDIQPLPPRPVPRRQTAGEAGPMTADQIQARALRGFERADADSDGVVTTAEIERAVEAGQTGVRGWTRADRDGDGRLTRQEFQSVVAWRFQRADADQDGTVSVEERQAARQPAD
jgi:hypothetical protein